MLEKAITKASIVKMILSGQPVVPSEKAVTVFAPTNIALAKYWGKRDTDLHLPMNSSVSLSLKDYGCTTTLSICEGDCDRVILNGEALPAEHPFVEKASAFFDLFRTKAHYYFKLETNSNIPIAAGLASSACGFAAVVKALAALFQWNLSLRELSILARLGSGSASRSLYDGFSIWHKGRREDGMDSFAESLEVDWPEFQIGLCLLNKAEKKISSREGMQRTVETSVLYQVWPDKAEQDAEAIKRAILKKDFQTVGELAENNALTMHATMLAAKPPVCYWEPETLAILDKVWALRKEGVPVYATMDAGPNVKLLHLKKDADVVAALL